MLGRHGGPIGVFQFFLHCLDGASLTTFARIGNAPAPVWFGATSRWFDGWVPRTKGPARSIDLNYPLGQQASSAPMQKRDDRRSICPVERDAMEIAQ
jgi:hypothetical protein